MPNIKTYDTPTLDIRPTEVGIHATEAVGRRAGQFFNQMGQALGGGVRDVGDAYVAYQDHQEASRGVKDFSDLIIKSDDLWKNTLKNSDPNDPTVAAKFREEQLEPMLDKFKDGFTTQNSQRLADHLTEQYRTHMVHQTIAEMSTQAGIAVRANAAQTANNLASAANRNPLMLDTSLKLLETSLGAVVDSNQNLTPAEAAKVKTEFGDEAKKKIIHAAVVGMLDKNPNVDLDAIQKKYGQYVTGAEMQQFQKQARSEARREFLERKQAEDFHLQTQIRDGNNALARVANDNVTWGDDGKPIINPQVFRQLKETAGNFTDRKGDPISQIYDHGKSMVNWIESQQRSRSEKVVTDPATQKALYDGLFNAEKPTTAFEIYDAASKDKLDPRATQNLLSMQKELEEKPFRGPRFQAVMTAAKEITGADLTVDGHERYAGFMNAFIPQYIAQERAGTLKPNALNTKDPDSLISQTIKEFSLTPAARMNARIYKNLGMNNPNANPDINGDPLAPKPTGTKRMIGNTPVPAPIAGVAALQYNATKKQFRDSMTGKTYDVNGNEVK